MYKFNILPFLGIFQECFAQEMFIQIIESKLYKPIMIREQTKQL